jgi:F-type H+-transporting ATPase subunit delta
MGSATREARAVALTSLAGVASVDLTTGEQVLAAGRVIGDSSQLRSVLADRGVEAAGKAGIVAQLFPGFTEAARTLLSSVVASHWSSDENLLAGIEEVGIRVLAASAPDSLSIGDELFTFGEAVTSNEELELAVSSKLGSADGKASLVQQLLGGKASPQTIAIVEHLVRQPRGRRIGALISNAADIVADEAGKVVATVTTANALTADQMARLGTALSASTGRDVRINHVIDPSVIGGVRVLVGDDVIDGTVASRLNNLKLQLAP